MAKRNTYRQTVRTKVYIQCQKGISCAKGWNTPAKIKQRENIKDVIMAAVAAFGV
jgi:hypothetical protein